MALKTIDIPDESLEAIGNLCDIIGVEGKNWNDRLAKLLQDGLRLIEMIVRDEIKGKMIASLTAYDSNMVRQNTDIGQNVPIENSYFFDPFITPGKEEEAKAYFESAIEIKPSEK